MGDAMLGPLQVTEYPELDKIFHEHTGFDANDAQVDNRVTIVNTFRNEKGLFCQVWDETWTLPPGPPELRTFPLPEKYEQGILDRLHKIEVFVDPLDDNPKTKKREAIMIAISRYR